MFSIMPSGLVPVSNNSRCVLSPLVTVTSIEKPCSAISASGAQPSAISEAGRRARTDEPLRLAGPWSGMNASVTLSIRLTSSTESTGSSGTGTAGSRSARTGAGTCRA